jgi:hypothetical protein
MSRTLGAAQMATSARSALAQMMTVWGHASTSPSGEWFSLFLLSGSRASGAGSPDCLLQAGTLLNIWLYFHHGTHA